MKRDTINAKENLIELLEYLQKEGRFMNMDHVSMLRFQSEIDHEVMRFNERMRLRFAMNKTDPIQSILLLFDLETRTDPTLQVKLSDWFQNLVENDEILSYF